MSAAIESNKKYFDLIDFLRKHKTIPEKSFTHTALGSPPDSYPGSYCIEDEELEIFHNLYHKHVFDEGKKAHLTERHKDNSCVLIDLDLRHETGNGNKRKYTEEFISKFVSYYLDEVKKTLPNINSDYLDAYVMEKDTPILQSSKGVLKDGIHIMFPYIVTEPKLQYIWRYNMINNENVIQLMKDISVKNTLDDVFDIAVIERNNWQMYGSCKPNNIAYKLSYILKTSEDSSLVKKMNDKSERKTVKLLSIRNIKSDFLVDTTNINSEIEDIYKTLPKQQKNKKRTKIVNKKKKSPTKKNFLDNEDDLEFVKKVIQLLDVKRADGFNDWIRLGWCLHNIDYRLLNSWIEFSKQSYKFVDGECEKEWPSMENDGLGLGSLYLWAREDNLIKFNELSKTNLRKIMLDSLSIAPNDVAKVVYYLYKHDFVCSSSKKMYGINLRIIDGMK